jgi:hypothetical protein
MASAATISAAATLARHSVPKRIAKRSLSAVRTANAPSANSVAAAAEGAPARRERHSWQCLLSTHSCH